MPFISYIIETMKKIIFTLMAMLFLPALSFACKQISFEDANACIEINKSSSTFSLETTLSNISDEISIHCDITLPNSNHINLWACNGKFTYTNGGTKKIKLYANINNDYAVIEDYYNFDSWEWADDDDADEEYNTGDPSKIEVKTNNDQPERAEWNDLTINIKDNYWNLAKEFYGRLYYTVEYREDSNDSWKEAPDSYYDIDSTYTYKVGYLDFQYNRDGTATFDEFIRFNENFIFKVVVESRSLDTEWADVFYVWWSYPDNNYKTEQFTTKEMQTVKNIYAVWEILTNKLKSQNKNLYYSSEWTARSKEFKSNVYDIIINKSNKEYRDYDDFYKWFMEWFIYTQKLIKK